MSRKEPKLGSFKRLLRPSVTLDHHEWAFAVPDLPAAAKLNANGLVSQLESRTCLLYAVPKDNILRMVESLGGFSKMMAVGKKAKRIGLLFSTAQAALVVDPGRCEDIPDIEVRDYVFTDGFRKSMKKMQRRR